MEIKRGNVYWDMAEDLIVYDTSSYPKEHPLHSSRNEKVLGKMKDECAGRWLMKRWLYGRKCILSWKKKKCQESQRVKDNVVEKEIHEQYKQALFQKKQFWRHKINIPCSEGHA